MDSRSLFRPQPSYPEFVRLSKRFDRVPVVFTVHSDLETPLTAYLKLGGASGSFLLESVEKNEKMARFSVVGFDPARVFIAKDGILTEKAGGRVVARHPSPNPLSFLKTRFSGLRQAPLPGGPGFSGGLVGFLAYDIVRRFERLPEKATDPLGLPDLSLLETDHFAIFDHLQRTLRLVVNVEVGKGVAPKAAYARAVRRLEASVRKLEAPLRGVPELPLPGEGLGDDPLFGFKSNVTRSKFLKDVRRCQEYIKAGDIIQVVLSQRFEKRTKADVVTVYRLLRRLNPSPYMFLLRFEGMDLAGASPEMLLKVQDGTVETRPIAGTRPRGADEAADQALERSLLQDPKELAEHVMLVDLGRNDLGRVCDYGSVQVTQFQRIERYSHVMHIVSDVTGRLGKGHTAFDAFQSCFPAGTLSGAPKIRAMEIIEELEPTRRGAYGGAVVIAGYDGNLDSAITIRSLVLKDTPRGERVACVQAGAGLVADSVPKTEYLETCNKAKAVMLAVAAAEGMLPRPRRGRKKRLVPKTWKGR
jgi:anthranilate synthase component 1